MSEVANRYARVADGLTLRVQGVKPDRWSAATPCADWTVRDLVAHVTTAHWRVIANLDGTEPVDADLDADLVLQWRAATGAVAEALADEARASKLEGGMFGEQTFESLVGRLVCTDTLVYTRDLARATGQDETLDAGAVSRSRDVLGSLDEAIRRPGAFGPKIDPAAGVDAQSEFVNFCGRAL